MVSLVTENIMNRFLWPTKEKAFFHLQKEELSKWISSTKKHFSNKTSKKTYLRETRVLWPSFESKKLKINNNKFNNRWLSTPFFSWRTRPLKSDHIISGCLFLYSKFLNTGFLGLSGFGFVFLSSFALFFPLV